LISHNLRKPEAERESAAWYERQYQKIKRGLATMEEDLGDREFCHGSTFTLADVAAGYALGYLDQVMPDTDWRRDNPNLKKLASRLALRESLAATLPAL
jgi:glutathione S-transferase